MIEVAPNLFVGDGNDRDLLAASALAGTAVNGVPPGWYVISAAKTAHKAELGYSGNAAPKTIVFDGEEVPNPEYLMAKRERRLFLNLVDVEDPAYIRDEIVHTALEQVDEAMTRGDKVLIHCNQGQSRAPTLALLWLHGADARFTDLAYDEAAEAFRRVYPAFAPAKGMEGYARAHWGETA